MITTEKPPIGTKPRRLHDLQRFLDLTDAIIRRLEHKGWDGIDETFREWSAEMREISGRYEKEDKVKVGKLTDINNSGFSRQRKKAEAITHLYDLLPLDGVATSYIGHIQKIGDTVRIEPGLPKAPFEMVITDEANFAGFFLKQKSAEDNAEDMCEYLLDKHPLPWKAFAANIVETPNDFGVNLIYGIIPVEQSPTTTEGDGEMKLSKITTERMFWSEGVFLQRSIILFDTPDGPTGRCFAVREGTPPKEVADGLRELADDIEGLTSPTTLPPRNRRVR